MSFHQKPLPRMRLVVRVPQWTMLTLILSVSHQWLFIQIQVQYSGYYSTEIVKLVQMFPLMAVCVSENMHPNKVKTKCLVTAV